MHEDTGAAATRGSVGAAVVALAGALVFAWGSTDFCLDDAYIHLAYGKSLRLGEGLSYNPHDWELGATSPLWAVLLALVPEGTRTVVIVKALGAVLHGLTALLTAQIAVRLGRDLRAPEAMLGWGALAAGTLAGLHPVLLQGATSGMEVPLTAALLAGVTLAALAGRHGLATALATLSVWARPESLAYVGALAFALALVHRSPRALWPAAGAGVAMLAWCTYCLARSGYPLPNTFYVKLGKPSPLTGLRYLVERVATEEPWLVGVGGLVLILLLVRNELRASRHTSLLVAGAWLATVLAIALGRQLNPIVLFNMQRYFAIVAFIPAALVGAAVATQRPRAALWLVPCAAFLALHLPTVHGRARAQERNTHVLHTEVAEWVLANVPEKASMMVEGAGTLRYFTSRERPVIDMLGLNDMQIAHAASPELRTCVLAAKMPAYLAVPSEFLTPISQVFDGEVLVRKRDAEYAQSTKVYGRSVFVLRVDGLRPGIVERCRALLAGAGS